jgi:putative acetyltransferase
MRIWMGAMNSLTASVPGLIVRSEYPGDAEAISAMTREAFEDHPHSRQTEHLIVEALRRAGVLSVSLVAELHGEIVGHVAFSPAIFGPESQGWFGLGPLSVKKSAQRRGIGSALIHAGLATLSELSAKGCAVAGDPAYYTRFGFRHYAETFYEGLPPEYFMCLPLLGAVPAGRVIFHSAFDVTT